MDAAQQQPPELGPIDWWVWHRRYTDVLAVTTAVTRLRAVMDGVSLLRGQMRNRNGIGISDLDAEVKREGETRATKLAELAKAA